jgi:hypothetical protein
MCARAQPPSLDGGEVFAQDVNLLDGQSAADQYAVEFDQIGESDARIGGFFEQRRAAPRDEEDHKIVGAEAGQQLQRSFRSLVASGVGIGVPAQKVSKRLEALRGFGWGDDHASGYLSAQNLVQRRGHAVRGFAKSNDIGRPQEWHRDPARHERPSFAPEFREHGVADLDRRHGFEKDVRRELLAARVGKACGLRGLGMSFHQDIAWSASTPACATSTSWSSVPALTPIPPTH